MVANSNPSSNQEGAKGGIGGPTSNPSNGASNSATLQALKHDPGLSFEWSAEEQAILEDGLSKFSSEKPPLRYAKIALLLQGKTVRDVALRCKWMNKKETAKRRKEETRKNKDKKQERATDPLTKASSQSATRSSAPLYSLPTLPIDNDDGISYADIGGLTGQILEDNDQIFKKLSANLSNLQGIQVQDNIALLHKAWTNLQKILDDMSDMPAVMKQMPPLPVKINVELASSVISGTSIRTET